MEYTVTLTDWTQRRGYRNSGAGFRVRCFGMPKGDLNAMGHTVAEQFFRSYKAALKVAQDLAADYKATLHNDCA